MKKSIIFFIAFVMLNSIAHSLPLTVKTMTFDFDDDFVGPIWRQKSAACNRLWCDTPNLGQNGTCIQNYVLERNHCSMKNVTFRDPDTNEVIYSYVFCQNRDCLPGV